MNVYSGYILTVLTIETANRKLSLTQDPRQQSSLLRKIVDRIRNSLEMKVVIKTAVEEVATLLEVDRCLFFWYFDDTKRVQIVSDRISAEKLNHKKVINSEGQIDVKYYPLAMFGSAAWAIASQEMVINHGRIRDINNITRPQVANYQINYQSLSLLEAHLLVPVKIKPDAVGFIACLSETPRQWSAIEIEFMQTIAQQLEIGIRQAELYEQTQKQAARERLVNQITNQTRQSFDIEIILTGAIEQILTALEIDRCLVHLVEETNQTLPKLHQNKRETLEKIEQNLARSPEIFRRQHLFEICRETFPPSIDDFDPHGPITEWVIEHREAVIISDITKDNRIGPNQPEYEKAQIKSSLVMPVQANGNLHAILYLNQCSHIRFWSKNDRELAQAVADQLAISIQQAKLYVQTQKQAIESATQAENLAKTLRELQLAQAQLIQSEKLSSLGQLVAGVAHEINNPVSFIYGNIPYIERYVSDLIRLLNAYKFSYPEPPVEVQKIEEEIEVEFLIRDLPLILKSMNSGAERIREIVLALRTFSRLDESYHKAVDIHTGLESTLLILEGSIKNQIQIVRKYDKLPLIECYPSQLNQVFMNLMINAIDALKESSIQPKIITIKTEIIKNSEGKLSVQISIADNGPGIPHDIQAKIFDPFFTTKGVGQGSGLGLTVSYQTIVNQHYGQLKCYSEPGKGTEFMIEIPIKSYSDNPYPY